MPTRFCVGELVMILSNGLTLSLLLLLPSYSVTRCLWWLQVCLALEHERMHLETLMYMAVQQVRPTPANSSNAS